MNTPRVKFSLKGMVTVLIAWVILIAILRSIVWLGDTISTTGWLVVLVIVIPLSLVVCLYPEEP